MIKVKRRQHAVGQGFFHSAAITLAHSSLHYVYDCGSDNVAPLLREIQNYVSSQAAGIDILFLSHLDNDHVNGLDQLLGLIRAETIVLPYLSVLDRVLLACKSLETGSINASYAQMLGDPVTWFTDRNVSRLIFIRGKDGEGPQLPDFSNDTPGDQHPPEPSLSLDLKPLSPYRVRTGAGGGQRQVEIYDVTHDIALSLVTGTDYRPNWCFLPFVHPEGQRERIFRERVAKMAGFRLPPESGTVPRPVTTWLLQQLQTKRLREELVECYTEIRADRNLTSMSLYSGPTRLCSVTEAWVEYSHSRVSPHYRDSCGWLATGDANLFGQRRRTSFLKHFQCVRDVIGTMCLPHHGSRHNFNSEILFPNLRDVIAASGTSNSYGHPHSQVVRDVEATGHYFHNVTEELDTEVCESVTVR